MDEKYITLIKKYVAAFAAMIGGTVSVLIIRQHSSSLELAEKYLNFADAFTIPAVVMLMLGLLVWVSTTGSFDMLGYGLKRAKDAFIPSASYTHEQFYDYKMRKNKKRIKGYSFMFISGGIYLIPGVVFNVLFCFV